MRLTKKSEKLGYCLRHSSIKTWKCWDKLGQLEDIEEELGVDLITLLKAIILNQDFYFVQDGKVQSTENEIALNMDGDCLCLHIDHIGYFYAKDYGKTWALTKEELEK